MTACHHLRGGILGRRLWPPHVADTPVGEIRGYAQHQPPTGVGNYLALGLLSATVGVEAMASYAGWCFSTMTYCKKCALLREGQGTGIHPQ